MSLPTMTEEDLKRLEDAGVPYIAIRGEEMVERDLMVEACKILLATEPTETMPLMLRLLEEGRSIGAISRDGERHTVLTLPEVQ